MIHVKQGVTRLLVDVSRETFLTPEIGVPNKRHDRGRDDVR